MSLIRRIAQRTQRRAFRIRNKIDKTMLRVSVYRSLNHIYAQIIDDSAHATITSCSSLEMKDLQGDKKAVAHAVGLELAKRALEKKVSVAVFDRGAFLYHGRIKSLAEGIRQGGLQI